MKAIKIKPQSYFLLGFSLLAAIWAASSPTHSEVNLSAVEHIELADAQKLVLIGKILILDVREKSAYDKDHLPNAIAVPIGELDKRLGEFTQYKNEEFIVYCNKGSRGPKATGILNSAGFRGAKNLRGGIQAWRDASYATVKG